MNTPHFIAKSGSVSIPVYRQARTSGAGFLFRVAWQEGGKRQRKAFADERAAKEFSKAKAESLSTLGSAALTLSGAESRSYESAKRSAEAFGLSLESALGEWSEARRTLDGKGTLKEAIAFYLARRRSKDESPSVTEAVAAYLDTKRQAGKSPRHLQDLDSRLGRFAKDFACRMADLHLGVVTDWLNGLREVGPRSRRNYRAALVGLVEFSERKGWLAKGDVDFSELEREAEPMTEVTVFTPDELRTLLAHCRRGMKPFILLGAHCGIRHAELARMNWGQVHLTEEDEHFPHGWVEVKAAQSKNASKLRSRARRLIPVTPQLQAALLAMRTKSDDPVCPYKNPSNQLTKLARQSGVRWQNNALRHSYASYRLALIRDSARVADELGNSASMVFQHYRALVTPKAAQEWFTVTGTITGPTASAAAQGV
jgi:integrase